MEMVLQTAALAAEIRQEHQRVHQAIAAGLSHAKEAGRLLLEARQHIPHGGWIRFVEHDCGLSRSIAAGYIRVCERWTELEPHVQRVAHLPLRKALALLAEPKASTTANSDDLERQADEFLALCFAIPANATMLAETEIDGLAVYLYVRPSDHDGFHFYNVMYDREDGSATIDGMKRPIRSDLVFWAISRGDGFDCQSLEWKTLFNMPRWTYNEWLYGSHDEYFQKEVLGQPWIDNSALAPPTLKEIRASIAKGAV